MSKAPPKSVTQTQQVPLELRPAFESLYRSGFAAAREAAGQYPSTSYFLQNRPRSSTDRSSAGFALGASQAPNPYTGSGMVQASGYSPPSRDLPGSTGYAGPVSTTEHQLGRGGGQTSRDLLPITGQRFEGPFVAQPYAQEYEGLSQLEGLAGRVSGMEAPVANLAYANLSGAFLHPESNPYLMANLQAATRPMYEAFDKARQDYSSGAIASGAYRGSSRRNLGEAGMATDFQRNVGDMASQMLAQNYAMERNYQQLSPAMLQQAAQFGGAGAGLMQEVGAGHRALEQLGIEERMRQFEEGIEAPFRPLGPLASLLSGQGIGTVQIQRSPYAMGGIGGGIQGAAGGGIAGGLIGQYFGQPEVGAAAGAGLGAIGGALG